MSCHLCQGCGWVIAYRAKTPIDEFAFICSCDSAAKIKTGVDKFNRDKSIYWTNVSHDTGWKLKAHDVPGWEDDYNAWRESEAQKT